MTRLVLRRLPAPSQYQYRGQYRRQYQSLIAGYRPHCLDVRPSLPVPTLRAARVILTIGILACSLTCILVSDAALANRPKAQSRLSFLLFYYILMAINTSL